MTKQDIIDQVEQMTTTQEVKNKLFARVNLYPDTLQDEHLNDFENLVMNAAMDEDAAAAAFSKAANHMQAGLDKEEIDFATQMQDIAADAEATNKQAAALGS